MLIIHIGIPVVCGQNSVSSVPDNVFDYGYQQSETWRGSKFRERRSFWSNSYYMVGFSSDGIWGESSLLGSSTNGISSQLTFGYRLSPVYNVELSLSNGLLPYADWKVSRTDIDYYEGAFSFVSSIDAKAFFNITSYASRLEDPGRWELLYGAGVSLAYNGAASVGFVTSLRLKYNITNMLSLYIEPELSYYDNRLNGSSLTSDNGNIRTSVSAGFSMRVLNDRPLSGGVKDEYEPGLMSVALKSNLLYWAMAIPNIGVEVPLGGKFSAVGEFSVPWYKNRYSGYSYQMMTGIVEGRYWFNGCFEQGFFGGVGGSVSYYDFLYEDSGVQSDLMLTAGVTAGYYRSLSSSLGLEFSLSVGYLDSDNKSYEPQSDGYLVYQKTKAVSYFGPTNAHISLVWRPDFGSFFRLFRRDNR